MVTVVMVRHRGNPKKYLFRVPFGHEIKEGMSVIVSTKHGMREATAVADSIDIKSEEEARELFDGVSLPLMPVLMVETKSWMPLFEMPFSDSTNIALF